MGGILCKPATLDEFNHEAWTPAHAPAWTKPVKQRGPPPLGEAALARAAAARLLRLQRLKLFVLDNSVRESTVAQVRGHTLADKHRIMTLVKDCAFHNQLIATFGMMPRVDDVFAKELLSPEYKAAYSGQRLYCFAELRDGVDAKGMPNEAVPVSLQRAAEYKISNVVIELDMLCSKTNWNKLTIKSYGGLVKKRIDFIRANCPKPGPDASGLGGEHTIFVNIRCGAGRSTAECRAQSSASLWGQPIYGMPGACCIDTLFSFFNLRRVRERLFSETLLRRGMKSRSA